MWWVMNKKFFMVQNLDIVFFLVLRTISPSIPKRDFSYIYLSESNVELWKKIKEMLDIFYLDTLSQTAKHNER